MNRAVDPGGWLRVLAAGVRNPPAEEDFGVRYAAVMTACVDVAAAAWDDRSLMAALRKFEFWPSAAEIFALLRAEEHVLEIDAFRDRHRLAGMSDEDVLAVRSYVRWLAQAPDEKWVMKICRDGHPEAVVAAVSAIWNDQAPLADAPSVRSIAGAGLAA